MVSGGGRAGTVFLNIVKTTISAALSPREHSVSLSALYASFLGIFARPKLSSLLILECLTHPVILPQKSAREDTVMGTPRGDRSLRWKMPPFFLSDRRRWRDGRTNGVGRQSGSGDVTRTLSLSLSLSPSLCCVVDGMRRFPVAVVVVGSFVAVVPFHWRNVRHHSNRSHFASYGHRTTEREGEEEEEEGGGGRRHLFHGPLLCEARFSDHSFILLASPPASQHPQSART